MSMNECDPIGRSNILPDNPISIFPPIEMFGLAFTSFFIEYFCCNSDSIDVIFTQSFEVILNVIHFVVCAVIQNTRDTVRDKHKHFTLEMDKLMRSSIGIALIGSVIARNYHLRPLCNYLPTIGQ